MEHIEVANTNHWNTIFFRFFGRLYWSLPMLVPLKSQLSPLKELRFLHQGGRYEPFILWETQDDFSGLYVSYFPWKANDCFSNTEDVIVLSFICHFYDSKGRLMTLKSNTAALFASFFCQRFWSCIQCCTVHDIILWHVTKLIAWLSFAVKQSSYVCCYHSWSTNP